ncbi:uncharacterized protein LOC143041797 [Oratosquilla oratoria]|uniref:uncharacterized protein LOC143041797 n=1 Tax=Oratosquilla oratoria TaxID=337810 RepID=UPI003F75C14E
MLDYCYDKLRKTRQDLQTNLNRKLTQLIQNSDWTKNANPNFVVNLSDKELNSNVSCALGYGLKFAYSNNEYDFVDIAKSFCNLEKYSDLSTEDLNICKGIVYASLSKQVIPNCPNRFLKALRTLKEDNDLHVTRADKANAVVILNRVDYLSKMHDLLSDETTYVKLRNNPLNIVNTQFNKKMKLLLKGEDVLIKQFSSISPSLPYMYGLIKTHKPNNPVRPIISSTGSVSYKLSKWLVSLLKPLVGNISNSNIKNNVELVEKLNNLNIDFDFKLVSFDITSLFTNVPIDDLIVYLTETIDELSLQISPLVCIELIKLCIKDCKFEFHGEYYTQNFGMAMAIALAEPITAAFLPYSTGPLYIALSNISHVSAMPLALECRRCCCALLVLLQGDADESNLGEDVLVHTEVGRRMCEVGSDILKYISSQHIIAAIASYPPVTPACFGYPNTEGKGVAHTNKSDNS